MRHATIFHTPVVRQFLRAFSRLYLRLAGWRMVNGFPTEGFPKCVIIAAPHTSNWDLPFTLFAAYEWGLHLYWLGKKSIFKYPFGPVMRWLGGIEVDRSKSTNLVAASAEALVDAEGPVCLIVPPEGTRGKVREWKTGFYYIAQQAQVPIVLAYMDYAKKEIGNFGCFTPTGDAAADIAAIRAKYTQVTGKNPSNYAAD